MAAGINSGSEAHIVYATNPSVVHSAQDIDISFDGNDVPNFQAAEQNLLSGDIALNEVSYIERVESIQTRNSKTDALLAAKFGNQYTGKMKLSTVQQGVNCVVYESLTFSGIAEYTIGLAEGISLAAAAAKLKLPASEVQKVGKFVLGTFGAYILFEAMSIDFINAKAMYTQQATISKSVYYWSGKSISHTVASSIFGTSGLYAPFEYADPYFGDLNGLAQVAFNNYFS